MPTQRKALGASATGVFLCQTQTRDENLTPAELASALRSLFDFAETTSANSRRKERLHTQALAKLRFRFAANCRPAFLAAMASMTDGGAGENGAAWPVTDLVNRPQAYAASPALISWRSPTGRVSSAASPLLKDNLFSYSAERMTTCGNERRSLTFPCTWG